MRRGFLALLGLLMAACAAHAQPARRVALVIGNSDYPHVPGLKFAGEDASDMAGALERLGFEVALAVNADLDSMRNSVSAFARQAGGAEAALVFYSGHALRYRGDGYLVPVSATLKDDTSFEWDNLQLQQLTDALARARASFLIIEGCGSGRLVSALHRRDGAVIPGLGEVVPRPNMLVAISSAATGEQCDEPTRNALLTESLLAQIEIPGLGAGHVLRRVQQLVALRGAGRQTVEIAGSLPAELAFPRTDSANAAFRNLGADPAVVEMRGYVDRYGDHPLTGVVKAMLAQKEQTPRPRGAQADPWRGQLTGEWSRARRDKAVAARQEALEARWSREESDRQADIAAAERRRAEQERIERERLEREDKARIARQQEEERRRQEELAAAERRRLEQERIERERAAREEQTRIARETEELRKREELDKAERERIDRARIARELEEERKRLAEVAAAERRRQEQEKASRDQAEREDRARLVREQEEQRRRQADLAAAEQRRREQDEREERARLVREQEELRRRQAEADARRMAAATPTESRPAEIASANPVPISGQAVDEAARFTAERRRLELERIERERRTRPLDPELATPLPSEGTPAIPAAPNTVVAALPPTTHDARPLETAPKADTPEIIKSAQEELRRLGCYAGQVHGRMNNGTKAALENAGKRMGATFSSQSVTEETVRLLHEKEGLLCVGVRPPKEEEETAPRRPSIRREAPAQPKARVARPAPTPAQPRSSGGGSGCFTYNGRQFCQ